MGFITPAMLGLAAIAGPIILLYMLRLRRQEVKISSTMLWQRLMQDREANTPWQKLRRNLLLILQLLILAALVFALARPFLPVPSVAAGSVALLIDASASMNATDMPAGASRFEAAQEDALALVGDLANDEVMTVISVGSTPQVLSPPTSDRTALREAINRAEPTTALADWDAALALAGASIAGREDATIVIISDGGLQSDLPALSAETRFLSIGRETANMAITALATRQLDDDIQLFAGVTNYGPETADVILSIEVDGDILTADRVTVPSTETLTMTFGDIPEGANIIRAELTPPVSGGVDDYLALDDQAFSVIQPVAGGRVLLVTEGNIFLRQLLTAFPQIEAFQTSPDDIPVGEQFDLIILDRNIPQELPPGNLMFIEPTRSTSLFLVDGTFEDTRFLRQQETPILSFVDFEQVAIREAVDVTTPGWGQPIVEAEGGPLLLAGDVGSRRVSVITFDLLASDLPLRIDFPILMANLLQWYSPATAVDAPDGLRPGEPVAIRPQAATTEFRVTDPAGSTRRFDATDEVLTYAATDVLGVYQVELISEEARETGGLFAVNLFSEQESQIAPQDVIIVGDAEVSSANTNQDTLGQRELWPYLAGLALLILVVEWWVYHRGTGLPRLLRRSDDASGPSVLTNR